MPLGQVPKLIIFLRQPLTVAQAGWNLLLNEDLVFQILLNMLPECWEGRPVPLCGVLWTEAKAARMLGRHSTNPASK